MHMSKILYKNEKAISLTLLALTFFLCVLQVSFSILLSLIFIILLFQFILYFQCDAVEKQTFLKRKLINIALAIPLVLYIYYATN